MNSSSRHGIAGLDALAGALDNTTQSAAGFDELHELLDRDRPTGVDAASGIYDVSIDEQAGNVDAGCIVNRIIDYLCHVISRLKV